MSKLTALAFLCAALMPLGDLEVGKEVPDIAIKSVDGKEFKLADLAKDGKVVAVVSWSAKCPSGKPCIKRATEVAGKFAGNPKFQFLAVCTYGDTVEQLQSYVKDNAITYPVCHDEGKKIAKHFAARQVNAAYVIAGGKLFWRGGMTANGKDTLADAIEAALEGKAAPASDKEKLG